MSVTGIINLGRLNTYACPRNDHSGSKGAGWPSSPSGQSMSTVASIVARIINRLFSARFRPMQMLHRACQPKPLHKHAAYLDRWSGCSYRRPNPKFPTGNGSPFPPSHFGKYLSGQKRNGSA